MDQESAASFGWVNLLKTVNFLLRRLRMTKGKLGWLLYEEGCLNPVFVTEDPTRLYKYNPDYHYKRVVAFEVQEDD
jgi:hypothetical protein